MDRLFRALKQLVRQRLPRNCWRVRAGSLVLLLALQCAIPAAAQPGDEVHLKALFLYNFAKFVDWPKDTVSDLLCIGVIGDTRYADALEDTLAGKTMNGHGFVVKRLKSDTLARECQIVFVTASEKRRMGSILDALRGAAVLTVGEMNGFTEAGGVLNLELINNKLRFDANLQAAERGRLKISSKLLSLARIVREKSD